MSNAATNEYGLYRRENAHAEGGDGVGKGTAVKAAIATLLFSEKIFHNGEEVNPKDIIVIQTDFPQYWGLGALIRKMNSSVGSEYFKQHNYTKEEELNLRKALYSLDRLLTLMVIESLTNDPSKFYVQISDRGPFSPAITHAICFEHRKKKAYRKSLSHVRDADECYVKRLRPKSVLLKADQSAIGGDNGGRKELDVLERKQYQVLSAEGFAMLAADPTNLVTPVQTRVGTEWNDKRHVAAQFVGSMGFTCEGIPDPDTFTTGDFAHAMRKGKLLQLDARAMIQFFYPKAYRTFERMSYFEAKPPHVIAKIRDIDSFASIRHGQYFFNGNPEDFPCLLATARNTDPKKSLVLHEERCSAHLSELLKTVPIEDSVFSHLPGDIRDFGRYLLTDYTGGQLIDLIRHLEKHMYLEEAQGGFEHLLKQLFIPEAPLW